MIALDASTALQSFRDGVYDIRELGEKLYALLQASTMVTFKYADGSVLVFPSAYLAAAMVSGFEKLTIGGEVVVQSRNGQLEVSTVGGKGALEALISHLWPDGHEMKISSSFINRLHVHTKGAASVHVKDLSEWVQANGVIGKTINATDISGVQQAITSTLRGAGLHFYANQSVTTNKARIKGEWTRDPLYSAAGLVKPNVIGFWDSAASGTVKIVLDSAVMSLDVPREGTNGATASIRCEIPYYTAAGWEYLEVDRYEVVLGSTGSHTEAAQGAMTQFLLWPNWKMEGASAVARAFRVYPGASMSGAAPIVRVENRTSGVLTLPRVWLFSKNSDGKGSVSVLASVKLPAYSCKEFEFRHSETANCGYMYPLSIW